MEPVTRIGSLVLLALGAGALLLGALSLYAGFSARQSINQAQELADAHSARLADELAAIQGALGSSYVEDASLALLAEGRRSDQRLIEAARAAGIGRPLSIQVFDLALEEIELGRYPDPDFTVLEMLISARRGDSTMPEAHRPESQEPHLVFVHSLNQAGATRGFVLLRLPVDELVGRIEWAEKFNYLGLSQGLGALRSELWQRGNRPGSEPAREPVADSRLWLEWHYAGDLTLIGLRESGMVGLGGIVLLLLGLRLRKGQHGAPQSAAHPRPAARAPAAPPPRSEPIASKPSKQQEPERVSPAPPPPSPPPEPVDPAPAEEGDGLHLELGDDFFGTAKAGDPASGSATVAKEPEPEPERLVLDLDLDEEPSSQPSGPPPTGEPETDGDEKPEEAVLSPPSPEPLPPEPALKLDLDLDDIDRAEAQGSVDEPRPGPAQEAPPVSGDDDHLELVEVDEEPERDLEAGGAAAPTEERFSFDLVDPADPRAGAGDAATDEPQPEPEPEPKERPDAKGSSAEFQPTPAQPSSDRALPVNPGLFTPIGILGCGPEALDERSATLIAQGIGALAAERDISRIAVARDGRLRGPMLLAALVQGLRASGLHVVDLGAVPLPVLDFAVREMPDQAGVMVTGLHLPADWNGFRIMLGGELLGEADILGLPERLRSGVSAAGGGEVSEQQVIERYCGAVAARVQLERPLKVVVDCANTVTGLVLPKLLRSIGAEVIPLYADVDGSFPNHDPDPSRPDNLEDLRLCVRNFHADLGFAVGGAGDRLVMVGPDGEVIWPDRLLMLLAGSLLERHPGATVVQDAMCSPRLARFVEARGGRAIVTDLGSGPVARALRDNDALLGGAFSGELFVAEDWSISSDAMHAACRILEILAADTRGVDELLAELPSWVSRPATFLPTQPAGPDKVLDQLLQSADVSDAEVGGTHGFSIDYGHAWARICRSADGTGLLVRFEGDDEEATVRLAALVRQMLSLVDERLKLPL